MPQLLPFLAVAVVLVITPGPDMALVTKNALRHGRRPALMTAWGANTGLACWTVASAVGVGTVLQASATAFNVLRVIGAAYLVFLGVQALFEARRGDRHRAAERMGTRPLADRAAFRQGLLSNLSNPKIVVFFTSFIPQFIDPESPALAQSLVLGLLFNLLGLAWLSSYALFTARAGSLLHRPRVQTALQRVTAIVLIAFGLRLATERP